MRRTINTERGPVTVAANERPKVPAGMLQVTLGQWPFAVEIMLTPTMARAIAEALSDGAAGA